MESTAPARWSRSDSEPSSMICCGVRPAKAGLGAWHHAARFRPRVCRDEMSVRWEEGPFGILTGTCPMAYARDEGPKQIYLS